MSQEPYWKAELPHGGVTLLYSDGKGQEAPGEFDRIISDLQQGMPEYNVPQYFGSQPGIFHNYDHLVVARETATGVAAGMLGARWFIGPRRRYLYFWSAMVTEPHRRTSLISAMTLWMLEQASDARGVPDVLASKTYSPVAFRALSLMDEIFDGVQVYPRLDGGRQDPDMVDAGRELTAMLCPKLRVDLEAAVVYGGQAVLAPDFFPNPMPLSGDPVIDGFFTRLTRDDQILFMLSVPADAKAQFRATLRDAREARFRLRRRSRGAPADASAAAVPGRVAQGS